ncbi:MAG: hypothetical protein EU521_01905, partial [Promethearchaeota archaeon]
VELKQGILDFGRPSELLRGNKYLLEQDSMKSEEFQLHNIQVDRSKIINPVHIGKNTKIINSVIGPNVSIGRNSIIENSILENCVIERDVQFKNIITESSIIGSNVRIENITKENLIIGDKSVIFT